MNIQAQDNIQGVSLSYSYNTSILKFKFSVVLGLDRV